MVLFFVRVDFLGLELLIDCLLRVLMLRYILLLRLYVLLFLPNLLVYICHHSCHLDVVVLVYIQGYVMVLVQVYILGMDVADSSLDSMDCRLLANTMDRIAMGCNTNCYSSMCYNTMDYMLHSMCMVLPMVWLQYLPMLYMVCSHRL